ELKKENINLKEMTMTGGMKTQAGTNRLIPIHPKIQDLIRYYYNRSDGEFLFYDDERAPKERMTYDKYRGRFKKVMARHG
ncbi:MAG: site-specific integrase, partial [Lachnospiraceae bacterium]|nr:site-specific integrase [Lachnospiraceae bacterium]